MNNNIPSAENTTPTIVTTDFALEPEDNRRLANLCGPLSEHLRQIEHQLDVSINRRSHAFIITGLPASVTLAVQLLQNLYADTKHILLTPTLVHLALVETQMPSIAHAQPMPVDMLTVRVKRGLIKPRGINQQRYVQNIFTHDINFGIGPAGTGKTYLAVACAVEALERGQVSRILLVRPAVEAGERLGFLPGDLIQKIDSYLRPLYDALYEMLGCDRVAKLTERNTIEVAPLAYMRGRTISDAFVLLDEAQNTTVEQMKMFLTRIGFGAKAVITGDITQVDLPRDRPSGLRQVISILQGIAGISFTHFATEDVVRHPLVQRIIAAYAAFEQNK